MIPELLEKIGGVVSEDELRFQLHRRGRNLSRRQLDAAIAEGLVAEEPGGYRSTAPPLPPRQPRRPQRSSQRSSAAIQAERELIARLWAEGQTGPEIAETLGISSSMAFSRIATMRGGRLAVAESSSRRSPPRRRGAAVSPTKRRDWATAHRKVAQDGACRLCSVHLRLDPAHLWSRQAGGDESEDNIVALCRRCHRLFDEGKLDLGPYLTSSERLRVCELAERANPGGGLHAAHRRLYPSSHLRVAA